MRPAQYAASIRSRTWSRSTISAPNAPTTNTVMKMSSSAVRLATNRTPSATTSSPAMAPINVDRLIRRAIRVTSTARITPNTAALSRQPNPV